VLGDVPFRVAEARRAPHQTSPELRVAEQLPLELGLGSDGDVLEHGPSIALHNRSVHRDVPTH
jgi:hypothetical protein